MEKSMQIPSRCSLSHPFWPYIILANAEDWSVMCLKIIPLSLNRVYGVLLIQGRWCYKSQLQKEPLKTDLNISFTHVFHPSVLVAPSFCAAVCLFMLQLLFLPVAAAAVGQNLWDNSSFCLSSTGMLLPCQTLGSKVVTPELRIHTYARASVEISQGVIYARAGLNVHASYTCWRCLQGRCSNVSIPSVNGRIG